MSPDPVHPLIYKSGDQPSLQVLDQLLLPYEKKYIDVPDIQTTWSVIRNMQIRGKFEKGFSHILEVSLLSSILILTFFCLL